MRAGRLCAPTKPPGLLVSYNASPWSERGAGWVSSERENGHFYGHLASLSESGHLRVAQVRPPSKPTGRMRRRLRRTETFPAPATSEGASSPYVETPATRSSSRALDSSTWRDHEALGDGRRELLFRHDPSHDVRSCRLVERVYGVRRNARRARTAIERQLAQHLQERPLRHEAHARRARPWYLLGGGRRRRLDDAWSSQHVVAQRVRQGRVAASPGVGPSSRRACGRRRRRRRSTALRSLKMRCRLRRPSTIARRLRALLWCRAIYLRAWLKGAQQNGCRCIAGHTSFKTHAFTHERRAGVR